MSFDMMATEEKVKKVIASLEGKGYEVIVAKNKVEALEKIKGMIPEGASVMNGSSVTLEQIGFVELLKSGGHKWNNLHQAIVEEKDPEKQGLLRRQSVLSDWYLGSVHALVEDGQMIIASNTGSQLPHVVFTSANLVLVVSTKKIVGSLDEAMERLTSYVMPLEEKHMMEKYGWHTADNKILIFRGENSGMGRKIRVVLVEEDLGF